MTKSGNGDSCQNMVSKLSVALIFVIFSCSFAIKKKPTHSIKYSYDDEYYYNECTAECEELTVYQPLEVEIGVYITQITDVVPDTSSFFAVGYYWIIWPTW